MITNINLRSDFPVDMVQNVGSDLMICRAARVSTMGSESLTSEESAGLINFLMKGRHGSPFEHGLMTFRVSAPIFVWREFMRHRIGWSYNEQSGRYMEMLPQFYTPNVERPLVQIGKAGAYLFEPGDLTQYEGMFKAMSISYETSWEQYTNILKLNVAKEVARMVLPVATYSSAYVTCNARSMMSFLSLRTKDETSMFPSYPQWEINKLADAMEVIFKELYPLTHAAFQANGRVSP